MAKGAFRLFEKPKLERVIHLFSSFFHHEPAKTGEFVEYYKKNMRKPFIIILLIKVIVLPDGKGSIMSDCDLTVMVRLKWGCGRQSPPPIKGVLGQNP